MNQFNFDIRKADSSYRGIPPFVEWKDLQIDKARWERNINRLESVSQISPEVLDHARRIVRRYAAVETGAVEKLYNVDRGFTWTVAVEMADIQSLLSEKGNHTRGLIESQLSGYDFILDLATGQRKITEAWIRELHQVLCKNQKTFSVYTSQGPQEQSLPLGKYKKQPNHVMKADSKVHSYAPVDMVGAEMHRLIKEFESSIFQSSNPVLQASYAHYCFVHIHPFSDGNGRVARALASVFLYRANSIPFLVLAEDRSEYLDSLEFADIGDYQNIVDFTVDRCYNAIDLIELSIKAGSREDISSSLDKLSAFYQTRGGFSHEEVDKTALSLIAAISEPIDSRLNNLRDHPHINEANFSIENAQYQLISEEYRLFLNGTGRRIRISLSSKVPANASVLNDLRIYIPKDCDVTDDFMILSSIDNDSITARINEIMPSIKPSLKVKLDIFAESVIADLVYRLLNEAKKVYKK